MKKLLVFLVLLAVPIVGYGEELEQEVVLEQEWSQDVEPATLSDSEFSKSSIFDPSNSTTSSYARKTIIGEKSHVSKKEEEFFLSFDFDGSPYIHFADFLQNGSAEIFSGFINTIYYREGIKIKEINYESKPVKTNKIGVFSTNLRFTTEEGTIYHYKNVPYIVKSEVPTIFFSTIKFDQEAGIVSGRINLPNLKHTYQIDLFYTDNEEYHYQEVTADEKGNFLIKLNRNGLEDKMYLRASDGLGNYADACDVSKGKSIRYGTASVETSVYDENKQLEIQQIWKQSSTANKAAFGTICLSIAITTIERKNRKRRRKMLRYY